mgnify:FL=1
MSELRITPVQVPVSQARGVDEMGFAGQPSYPGQPDFGASMGFPGQPGAFAAPTAAPRSYSAPASGGALAAAYLIDMVCFAALTALAWWVYPSLPVVVIVACELWIIATFIRARSGRTPGAFAMQIAAISTQPTPTEHGMEFDRAPGLGRQSAHSFIMLLLHVTVVGPVITWAIARDGQTWVDRVCGMGNLDIRASRSGASEAVFASRQTSASEAVPGSVAAPSPAHQWAGPSASPEAVPGSVAASSPAPMAPPTTAPVQVSPPSAPVAAPDPVVMSAPAPTGAPVEAPIAAPAPTGAPVSMAAPAVSAPVQQPVPPAGPAVPARHGGASAMPKVPQAPTPQASAPQQAAPRPSFASAPTLAIIVDDGQRIEVNAQIVLGRAPEQTPADAQAIAIADSTRSLSRTHLRVAPADGEALWIEDTFSANGTRLQAPDGSTQPLPRGQRVKVPVGTVLLLGERRLSVSR